MNSVFCLAVLKPNLFVHFLEESEETKKSFQNYLTFSKAPEYLHELELLGTNSKELSDLIKP